MLLASLLTANSNWMRVDRSGDGVKDQIRHSHDSSQLSERRGEGREDKRSLYELKATSQN